MSAAVGRREAAVSSFLKGTETALFLYSLQKFAQSMCVCWGGNIWYAFTFSVVLGSAFIIFRFEPCITSFSQVCECRRRSTLARGSSLT